MWTPERNPQWTPDDVITTDKYLTAFPSLYHKTDVFYLPHPIMWRDQICRRPSLSTPTIVSGHSDYPIVPFLTTAYSNTAWFTVNNQSPHAYGLPLGVTNNTEETENHPVYGNVSIMWEVAQTPRVLRNLVYMNFSVNTFAEERGPLWNRLADKAWVTQGQHVPTLDGRRQFLTDIRNHAFVLCPRGAGIDTHRLWETLYMGSIPIVIWDRAHENWKDLPILFIHDWSEITLDRLLYEHNRITHLEWNTSKLKAQYWVDYIHEGRNRPRRH